MKHSGYIAFGIVIGLLCPPLGIIAAIFGLGLAAGLALAQLLEV